MINSAIILAGGKSTRMGFDKQLIEINGEKLPIYLGKKLKKHFDEIVIVTYTPEFYQGEDFIIAEDIYKHLGPLGGLHAGLLNISSEGAFLIACDMPFINDDYIEYIKNKFCKNKSGIVAKRNGYIEPMMGVYNKNLLEDIERRLEKKDLKLLNLIRENEFEYLEEEILTEKFGDLNFFKNINYKEDLKIIK